MSILAAPMLMSIGWLLAISSGAMLGLADGQKQPTRRLAYRKALIKAAMSFVFLAIALFLSFMYPVH